MMMMMGEFNDEKAAERREGFLDFMRFFFPIAKWSSNTNKNKNYNNNNMNDRYHHINQI